MLAPGCHCATSKAIVRIRLRHTGHVTVTIVDSAGHTVATIASNVLVHARSPQHWPWDGRTDAGGRAPDGVYHPWVHVPHQTFRLANNILLDTKAPKVVSASVARPLLFAAPGRTVAIRYTFGEPAHAVVYLGRRRIIFGRRTRQHDKVKWTGALAGAGASRGQVPALGGRAGRCRERDPCLGTQGRDGRRPLHPAQPAAAHGPERRAAHGAREDVREALHLAPRPQARKRARKGPAAERPVHDRARTGSSSSENGHATTAVVRVRAK